MKAELMLNNLVRLLDGTPFQIKTFKDLDNLECMGMVLNNHNVSKYFEEVENWGMKCLSEDVEDSYRFFFRIRFKIVFF